MKYWFEDVPWWRLLLIMPIWFFIILIGVVFIFFVSWFCSDPSDIEEQEN